MPSYRLNPAQRVFFHVQNPSVDLDVCCYQGGYGSGKTFIGSFLGLHLAEKYPGVTGLCGALTYTMIKDILVPAYVDHLDAMGFVRGKHYLFSKSDMVLSFPGWGGSKILFRYLEDPEKIKGLNLGFAHLDEASQLPESTFLQVQARVRADVPRRRIFLTTNPQSNKGWIHKYFVEQAGTVEQDGAVIEYRRVIAPTKDNAHNLPAGYIANMESAFDPEYYRINVLGEDADYTSGLVCHSWSDANIEETPYRPDLKLYLTCDFNVDPMSWALAHRYNGEYHFFDELVLENTTTHQAAEAFYRRYGEHRAGIVLTGDASGDNRGTLAASALDSNYTILRQRLSSLGVSKIDIDLPSTNPFIDARTQSWNAAVCNSLGVRRVKVDPKCKWLIYNCENLRYVPGSSEIWEPTAKQIEKDRNLKFTKHVWDAASYLVHRYDPIDRKQPTANKPRYVDQRFQPTRTLGYR